MASGLVMFAVTQEARPFVQLARAGGLRVVPQPPCVRTVSRQWTLDGHQVVVSGMGTTRAVAAAQAILDAAEPEWVLTCGFAGALAPGLKIGDLVHDADPWFPIDPSAGLPRARPGRFHCSRRVAVTRDEKTRLHHDTGADVVEMESGAVRDLCRARGVPSATLRVVSDEASEDLPLDFNALMTASNDLHAGRMAWAIAQAPWKIVELLRFQRRVARASDVLARALVGWMQQARPEELA
jgi:adenosylhomocysteine nucleosidase